MAILKAMPHSALLSFGIGVRSRFIDELLLEALATERIATVLCLGCGLDTRPWRLELPAELRWIEADFADMLDYKDSIMSGETPRCRLERFKVDVNDAARRRALFSAVGPAQALVIAEGLLLYLPAATVDALADEVPRECGVAHWISDISTAAFQKAINSDTRTSLRHVQASDSPEGEQIMETMRRHGWVSAARRSYLTDMAFASERIQQIFGPVRQTGGPPPIALDDPSGVHRFIFSK